MTIATLVQKDPLLLGTDVLSSIGFYCTFQKPGQTLEKVDVDSNKDSDSNSEVVKTQVTEELKGESSLVPEEADTDPNVKNLPMGKLQLAKDIRISSHCRKVVKAVITTAEP